MQIKIKYHSDIDKIETIEKGNWIDLRASETITLQQGEFKLIPLGVSMKLPDGYEAYILPRSSTFKNWGILQTNGMGVVDSTYSGTNDIWRMPVYATRNTVINKNDRICQFRITDSMKYTCTLLGFTECEELDNVDRGGFGSTGVSSFDDSACNKKEVDFQCLKNNCKNCYDDDAGLYCKLR